MAIATYALCIVWHGLLNILQYCVDIEACLENKAERVIYHMIKIPKSDCFLVLQKVKSTKATQGPVYIGVFSPVTRGENILPFGAFGVKIK